jgi:Glycosyl hydrolase family 12
MTRTNAARRFAPAIAGSLSVTSCAALDAAIGPPPPPRGEEAQSAPATPATTAAPAATASTPAGARSDCESFGSIDVGAEYFVQNNAWNTNQEQCISVQGTRFAVTRAGFHLPTNGPPASYPAIVKGCHWGHCTTGSGMPARVDALGDVASSWEVTHPQGGAFDVAYDLWFNKTPVTGGQPDAAELMVWLDHGGGVQPAGRHVDTVTLAGASWDLWVDDMGWQYIAYVRNPPTGAVRDLDLHAFVTDSVARKLVSPTSYLIAIEAGFELWQGGRDFETRSFQASVAAHKAP